MADRTSNVANAFETTLSTSISDSDISFEVASTAGGPTSPAYIVIDPDDNAKREIIYCDGTFDATHFRTSTTANRHLDGSAATSGLTHASGAVVAVVPVAQHIEDLHDRIDGLALGATDHGTLTGLADDDHTQYHNTARHAAVDHDALTDHGGISGLADDDHTQYLNSTRHDSDDHSGMSDFFTFAQTGALTTGTGTVRFYPPYAITIQDVSASVGTAPTGATLIVDVNRSGTTIFTTQSNRPQITASTFFDLSGAPSVTAVSTAQYVTVDIDQIGSTVAGSDLTVVVRYKRA